MVCDCVQHDDRDESDDWRTPRFRGRGGFIGGRGGFVGGRGGFTGGPRGRGFSRGSVDIRRRPPFRPRSPFGGGGGELFSLFVAFSSALN